MTDTLEHALHDVTQKLEEIQHRMSPDFDFVTVPAHEWRWLKRRLLRPELDDCSKCRGARGGTSGNENIIKGKLYCDFCSIEEADALEASWPGE